MAPGNASRLLLAIPLLIMACSGGGGNDGGGGGDPLSCSLNTSFLQPTHANGTIVLQTASTPCAQLDLDVTFTGISGIFTVGFDITFPSGILSFDRYRAGPLLQQGSPTTPPAFSVSEISPGRLAVFATRFSPDGAVSATGDTVLLTLSFRATSLGQGPIVFDLSSSPVEEQVLDQTGSRVSATFVNGSNLARVF